jgi:hypothetical protein
MITIENLTDRQRMIMDLLWQCNTVEQVQTLIKALPTKADQRDALSLVQIATMEGLEEEGGLDEYKDAAKAAIDHCR